MKRAKYSQQIKFCLTYEMAMWVDGIKLEAGADSRSEIVRSMLQTLMDEDIREQAKERAA